jgi:hypothetical protein
MKSNVTSESRPRAPAVRVQGDGAASTNMLSISSLSDFFDTSGPVDGESASGADGELARRTFVSITLNRKRTALAVAVEGGKGRKQFCAFSARARFHTA